MIFTKLKHIMQLNIMKTIIFNFSFFKLKDAIKFPVLIWGKIKIDSHRGTINIKAPIKTGIIKLGISDPVRSYGCTSFFKLEGTLNIGKNIIIRKGMRIDVEKTGVLTLDDYVVLGDCVTVIVKNTIIIQKYTRIGNNTTLMDTDFHYIINTTTHKVKNNTAPIIIGEENWIGGWCTIKKGSVTPKGTIIAGPYSMIGKDYRQLIPEYSLIGGSPAKLILENMRRIHNLDTESSLSEWFKTHIEYENGIDIDQFCLPQK